MKGIINKDMTPEQRQQQFYTELKELLKKYKAQIILDEEFKNYSYTSKIVVEFEYDERMFEKHNTGIIPTLELGTYEDGR